VRAGALLGDVRTEEVLLGDGLSEVARARIDRLVRVAEASSSDPALLGTHKTLAATLWTAGVNIGKFVTTHGRKPYTPAPIKLGSEGTKT
jgi:hypothetical protein